MCLCVCVSKYVHRFPWRATDEDQSTQPVMNKRPLQEEHMKLSVETSF